MPETWTKKIAATLFADFGREGKKDFEDPWVQ
jgi:hypothetical protein